MVALSKGTIAAICGKELLSPPGIREIEDQGQP